MYLKYFCMLICVHRNFLKIVLIIYKVYLIVFYSYCDINVYLNLIYSYISLVYCK